MSDGISGGSYGIKNRLVILKEELMNRFVQEGQSEEEAAARIERDYLLGFRSSPDGVWGSGLYASPDAVALADLKPIPPKAPRTWRSANQLVVRREVVGCNGDVDKKLGRLRDELIREAVAAGTSESEAAAMVDRDSVGYRSGGGGPEALYASPDALQRLFDRGELERREPRSHRSR